MLQKDGTYLGAMLLGILKPKIVWVFGSLYLLFCISLDDVLGRPLVILDRKWDTGQLKLQEWTPQCIMFTGWYCRKIKTKSFGYKVMRITPELFLLLGLLFIPYWKYIQNIFTLQLCCIGHHLLFLGKEAKLLPPHSGKIIFTPYLRNDDFFKNCKAVLCCAWVKACQN